MNKTIDDIMPATEVRDNFKEVLDYIESTNKPVTITKRGRGKVVMMSYEEFDSWRETLDIMANNPNIAEELKEAQADIRAGRYVTLDEIFEREKALFVAEKKSKYKTRKSNLSAKKKNK